MTKQNTSRTSELVLCDHPSVLWVHSPTLLLNIAPVARDLTLKRLFGALGVDEGREGAPAQTRAGLKAK